MPDSSAILLGCSGDSGVYGLDCGSGVTGLEARWSSVTYLNSQRFRGSSHQEKKSVSGCTGCVQTHQAFGMLWTHPGRAHTAPNAKRTGNVNSDAARHGICLPDRACQIIFLLDATVSGHFPSGRSCVRAFSFGTQPCKCIFLLGAAMSGQMASGRHLTWHHGHAVCQGTEHRSKYCCRIRKHAAGSRHSDSVQFYSFYLTYIYICYYHTSHGNKGKLANTTRRVEHDTMSTTR